MDSEHQQRNMEGDTFEVNYDLGDLLGSGSYGDVYKCYKRNKSDEVFAVKVINKADFTKEEVEDVYREIQILKRLKDVKHVVQLIDFFESTEDFRIVLE